MVILAVFLIVYIIVENSSIYYRSSLTLPFTLHLNKQDIYMIKGEETHLSVFGLNKRVAYHSTNFRVAGVNFNGRVFAYRTGKAFIIAKVDGKELKCRVHVIDINKESIYLKRGQAEHLKIVGTSSFVSWKCKKTEIASVNLFGRVRAINKGTAVITAKVKGRTLRCTVNVN